MRKTKLILIVMLSVLTLTSSAQSITSIVSPSSDTLCNGSAVFTGVTSHLPVKKYSSAVFIWMQQGTTPISTFTSDSTAYNLCPGVYTVEVWSNMLDTMYYSTIITILSPSTHLAINELENEPKLVRVLDIIGNDSELDSNKLLILVYSNGTRKKRYVIEN